MKESHPSPKRLLSLKHAAGYMDCGVYKVREMIWSGQIPIVRDGREIFLEVRDLDRYIDSKKQNYFLREADQRRENGKKKNGG